MFKGAQRYRDPGAHLVRPTASELEPGGLDRQIEAARVA